MVNWDPFWTGMGIFAAVGIISALFADKINQVLTNVEYYASGHVTDHHVYEPFD